MYVWYTSSSADRPFLDKLRNLWISVIAPKKNWFTWQDSLAEELISGQKHKMNLKQFITPQSKGKEALKTTRAMSWIQEQLGKIMFAKDNPSIRKNINYICKDVGSIYSSFWNDKPMQFFSLYSTMWKFYQTNDLACSNNLQWGKGRGNLQIK